MPTWAFVLLSFVFPASTGVQIAAMLVTAGSVYYNGISASNFFSVGSGREMRRRPLRRVFPPPTDGLSFHCLSRSSSGASSDTIWERLRSTATEPVSPAASASPPARKWLPKRRPRKRRFVEDLEKVEPVDADTAKSPASASASSPSPSRRRRKKTSLLSLSMTSPSHCRRGEER